jgi:hypothetical protein
MSRNSGWHRVGAGEREALAHAAREVLREVVGEVGEAHQRQVAVDDRVAARRVLAVGGEAQAELDVAAHREPGKDAVLLEDDAAVGPGALDRRVVEQDDAARRLDEAADHVHQRRLAAARGDR